MPRKKKAEVVESGVLPKYDPHSYRGAGRPPARGKKSEGREKSSLKDLSDQVVSEFLEHFKANGLAAINRVHQDDPSTYLKIATGMVKKEQDVSYGDPIINILVGINERAAAIGVDARILAGGPRLLRDRSDWSYPEPEAAADPDGTGGVGS